jgi:hypothetical protein
MSGNVKPLRWGWISAAPPTEALGNKHLWAQSSVLDMDPASRGGEAGDEDGGDSVGFCVNRRPSSRSTAVLNADTEASGSVPAVVLDGGVVDL